MGGRLSFFHNFILLLPYLFFIFIISACFKATTPAPGKFTLFLSGRILSSGSVREGRGVGGLGGGPFVRQRHAQTDPLPPPDEKTFKGKNNFPPKNAQKNKKRKDLDRHGLRPSDDKQEATSALKSRK